MNAVNQSPCRTAQEVSEMSKATANQKILNQKMQDMENKLKYYEQANQRLSAQLNDQQELIIKEKGKLQKDKDVLVSKLSQKESQIEKLLDENDKLVKTIKKIQTDTTNQNQLREENDNLRKRVEDQEIELEDLRKKMTNADKKWSSDAALGVLAQKRREEIQVLTNDNSDLKSQIQELQKRLNNILQENQQLQQIILQQESASQRQHSQGSSIMHNNNKNNYYDSSQKKQNDQQPSFWIDQINQLRSDLSDAKQTIDKLKKLNAAKSTNSNTVSPNNKVVQQVRTANSPQPARTEMLNKNSSIGTQENDNLTIRDLQEKIRQLEFEKDSIAQSIRLECAQDMKKLQDKLREESSLQNQITKEEQRPQQDELKKLSIENQKLQKLITRQEKEMQNMEQKLTNLLISQEDIQQSLKREKQFQDYLKNEKSKLQGQLKEKQEELNDQKDDIIKLSKERQQLKESLEKFQNEAKVNQSNKPASQKSEIKKKGYEK